MSDLISRSALLEKFSRNNIYSYITDSAGKNVLEIIEEMPTVLDLESTIEQIKEEENRLLSEMELFGKTQGVSLELVFIKYNQALVELVKVRGVLESAANGTNKISKHGKLKSCPFCKQNEVQLIYLNPETQETCRIDTDEELDSRSIVAYVHCYECDIDFYADSTATPREVMEKWNRRK